MQAQLQALSEGNRPYNNTSQNLLGNSLLEKLYLFFWGIVDDSFDNSDISIDDIVVGDKTSLQFSEPENPGSSLNGVPLYCQVSQDKLDPYQSSYNIFCLAGVRSNLYELLTGFGFLVVKERITTRLINATKSMTFKSVKLSQVLVPYCRSKLELNLDFCFSCNQSLCLDF